jgi:hypothetical protein
MTIAAIAVAASLTVLTGASGALGGTHAGTRAAALGGWGTAQEVPGTATLNQGGAALVTSVSCPTAGNCSAGGTYFDSTSQLQSFVVNEVSGTWHSAEQIPGTSALGSSTMIQSLSCATAGNCSAAGQYTPTGTHEVEAFVADEVNGTWQSAIEVPGTASLNQLGQGQGVLSVSCPAAGDCSAVGQYEDSNSDDQVFVADEVNGTWQDAIEVPGTATLNQGGSAAIYSVSCRAAGNCSAGGSYRDSSRRQQAFVASEVNGTWQDAIEVPGTATLNQDGGAAVSSVSCATAGNCSAGGTYLDSANHMQVFVANEVNGTWRSAIEVPGTATLNQGGSAVIHSVSCATAGNCSAAGSYLASATSTGDDTQAFVADEVNGTWHAAIEVPGTAALNKSGSAQVFSVSCATAGNCSAGGSYYDAREHTQAFVANEVNGTWQTAIEVPGTAKLNTDGFAETLSVSCPTAASCSAGGAYRERPPPQTQAFVVNKT